ALELSALFWIGTAVDQRGMHEQCRRCELQLLLAQMFGPLILAKQAVGKLLELRKQRHWACVLPTFVRCERQAISAKGERASCLLGVFRCSYLREHSKPTGLLGESRPCLQREGFISGSAFIRSRDMRATPCCENGQGINPWARAIIHTA